jgi:hypothetical protein
MTIRKAAITEIENVLSLRRSAHRTIPGQKERFVDQQFQKKYDSLKVLLLVIMEMSDKEINHYLNRALRKKERKEEPSLFE